MGKAFDTEAVRSSRNSSFLDFVVERQGGGYGCEKWHWRENSSGKPTRRLGKAAPSYTGSARTLPLV